MTERILVTGAAGHIGRRLVRRLAAAGHAVTATDIAPAPPGLPCTWHPADLRLPGEVADLFRAARPDRVVHLGATLTGLSEARPHLAMSVNVQGLLLVLEACREAGLAELLFASSVGTYGRDLPEVVDDLTLQRPVTLYGATKLFGESLGRWYATRYGFGFRGIRFPQVVAPGIRTPRHWAPPMLDDALASQPHLCTEGDPGSIVHAMSAADAARAAEELLFAPPERLRMGVYTVLGLPGPISAGEMAAELARRRPGFSVRFATETAAARPPLRYSDRVARTEWGWTPEHATLDALLEAHGKEGSA